MTNVVGECDIALITLDTLRWDVADMMLREGRLPNLAAAFGFGGWEQRHTPASFTYAAHHAFFSGFLPTPTEPGRHPRLFAAAFEGSETTVPHTAVFDQATVVEGLAARGYHTICAGGTGFFNERTELGRVLPGLFETSRWCPEFGVTDPDSTRHQCEWVLQTLADDRRRAFIFVNVSAIHQPNCHYLDGKDVDDLESHAAALAYVDTQLPPLFDALRDRGPGFVIICSDHGTAYGEDGYHGHRCAHPAVWNVPYRHFFVGDTR